MTKTPKTKLLALVARIQVKAVQGSIWQRKTDRGTFFDASFQRGYHDGKAWKNTKSFTSMVSWLCSMSSD